MDVLSLDALIVMHSRLKTHSHNMRVEARQMVEEKTAEHLS